MEILKKIILKFVTYFFYGTMLLFCFDDHKLRVVFATKEHCRFTAIFNFGDSNSDTGGLDSAFPIFVAPPYGETYFGEPSGRFSDGRLLIDFVAESFEVPYVNAYLDSLRSSLKQGANFATASSTIRLPNRIIPSGGFSPFYLYIQFSQFARLKSKLFHSFITNTEFGVEEDEYFRNALYTFDIGQNDLAEGFFYNKTMKEIKDSVPDIVNSFSTTFKNIYNISGGKTFWIYNTGPIGCLSYILENFQSVERDEFGCAKALNEVAKYFNHILKQAVVKLRNDFPLASITYIDLYSVKYSLFTHPHKYGFEMPLVACCGYGGKYNYSNSVGCGGTITVNNNNNNNNGIKKLLAIDSSCGQASVRVNWDGIHYTEAANYFIFSQISTGAFSDPPLPLKFSCSTSLIGS